ncbi:hypothetical protein KFU94_10975 [Chloroflexi bacterium TSY]|nr:hypothetical protein [Chloroflexi bacterium TSY]
MGNDGTVRTYIDDPVNADAIYSYRVKAILINGTELLSTPRLFSVVDGRSDH